MSPSKDIPTSRLSRGARLGGLAAGETVKYAGTRAANVTRSRSAGKRAIEHRHLQAADQILAVLGTMKGPAMKLGQILSFVDLGVLPKEVRPRFQSRLNALCAEAPEIPWSRMEPVLTSAFGRPITTLFREIDTTPIGTASIGQVYRATTTDGIDVAVKVQYPKIVAAAQADLKNLGMMLRLSRALIPSVDLDALAAELTDRFTEELDYEREAVNTLDLARAYDGHPRIKVPAPVLDLCGRTVLVTEHIDGMSFEAMRGLPAEQRDPIGEVATRFYLGSFFRLARFSGDPHPGNVKLLDDGRVGFLDFGSFKRLDRKAVGFVTDVLRAVAAGHGEAVLRTLSRERVFARPRDVDAEEVISYANETCGWFLTDETVTMSPRVASEAIFATIAPTTGFQRSLRNQNLPVEWALLLRAVVATMALLGQLEATGNWHRIAREWIYSDPPATPIGEAEAGFFGTPI